VEDVAEKKRADPGRVENPVSIDLRQSRLSSMEAGRRGADRKHPDIPGEKGVERMPKLAVPERKSAFKTGHLALGMDTGVCSSGPCDRDSLSAKLGQDVFDHPLDRPPIGLPLPAVEIRTVIAQNELGYTHSFRAI
jgi:hypothetical protein